MVAYDRVIAIKSIAATGVVSVVALVGLEQIVNGVVEATIVQCWASMITFRGMVKHNIENDLDPRLM